jgi:hypothetical protein
MATISKVVCEYWRFVGTPPSDAVFAGIYILPESRAMSFNLKRDLLFGGIAGTVITMVSWL